MGRIKLLVFVWIVAIAALAYTTFREREETTAFQGIADTREVVINSEKAVEIRAIHVVPGEAVHKGRLLVELERPELTIRINEIMHQMEELESRDTSSRDDISFRIRRLEMEKSEQVGQLDHKISLFQSRYQMNREMLSGLKSIYGDIKHSGKPGAAEIELSNLKKERLAAAKKFQTEIDDLNKKLIGLNTPDSIREEGLKKELGMLQKEREELLIHAPIAGVIGTVGCKSGEKISPFEPILTLHTKSPSYVRGYIHENIHNLASIGESVHISAITGEPRKVEGEIVGMGSRIVEYPLRLRKRPEIQMWGREVEISIPGRNPFLLGEKVMIQTESHVQPFSYIAVAKKWLNLEIYAAESEDLSDRSEKFRTIVVPDSISDSSPELEVSGLVYLEDLDRYLIISDETRKKKPLLYLMDNRASVTDELKVEGLDKIDDMEAICMNGSGQIFLACSQDKKKSNSLPDTRKQFVHIERKGTKLTAVRSVLLYDLLAEAAFEYSSEDWAGFIGADREKIKNIQIEGMFINGDSLYLGFKRPLKDKRAVILVVNDFMQIFRSGHIEKGKVRIWRELELNGGNRKISATISDLCLHNDTLFVLSSVREKKSREKNGAIEVFDFKSGKLLKTRFFQNLNPEGITFDSSRNCFVVTFDEGSDNPSKMASIINL